MIFHVELINEGGWTDGLFFGIGLVAFQLLIELALLQEIVIPSLRQHRALAAAESRSLILLLPLILVDAFQLPLEIIDILHLFLQIAGRKRIILCDLGERVASVVLQVVLMAYFGLMGGTSSVELYPREALEVIVAAVYAESALVVEQLTRNLEGEAAVHADVGLFTAFSIHY